MKKFAILFAGLFLMTFAFQSVNAQGPATETAVTNATIIAPIAITKEVDLNFGNIAALTNDQAVTITPAGMRSSTEPLGLPTTTPGTISAASFTVTGLADATYSIVLPTTFNVESGGNTMEVNAFTSTPTPTGVLTGGTETLTVGATINVKANQAAGSYTNASALSVTVAYN
ncbi:MAG TPA: DUF4402 domain-containing protein [Bacteroidales bacterium]|nr:DUF4402 domain-containing protein [Bacteroidales bacterium]